MAFQYLVPIHRASRQIARFTRERWSNARFGMTEAHILAYLRDYSPAAVSELHRVLGIQRSTLTSVLDRLEADGRLVRGPSKRDRRSITVELASGPGREAADRIVGTLERLEAEIGSRVTRRDFEGFRSVMTAIERATAPAPPPPGDRHRA